MKVLSELLNRFGIPLEEMASNSLSAARSYVKSDNMLNQLGLHMMKWLIYKEKTSVRTEIRAFLKTIYFNVLTKQVARDGLNKTLGLHVSPDQLMSRIDQRTAAYFAKASEGYDHKDLENLDLVDLDTLSLMGFSIRSFVDRQRGVQLAVFFNDDQIASTLEA